MLRPRLLLASSSVTVNPGPRASPTIPVPRRLAPPLRAAFIVLLQPHQTTLSRVPPPLHSPIGSCCPTARGPASKCPARPAFDRGTARGGVLLAPPFGGGAKLASARLQPRQGSVRLGSARFAARVGVGGQGDSGGSRGCGAGLSKR